MADALVLALGGAQGEEGAKDVVLRGLYTAAADRDFKTVCTSQTTAAQKGAAKGAGWDGNGDPLPMCEKYFKDNWSTIDAAYLRGRKVTETKAGANATTMIVSFSATCDRVKCGSPSTRFDQTNTIAVHGAAASRISPVV